MDTFWSIVKDKLMGLTLLEKIIILLISLLIGSMIITSLKMFFYLMIGVAIVIGGWYIYNKYTESNM